MKKGFFLLLAVVGFMVIVLTPATSFAATPTKAVTKAHTPHILPARNSSHTLANTLKSAHASTVGSSNTSSSSNYNNLNLTYHGGPVMTGTTQVYAIFWQPMGSHVSANYNSFIEGYFNNVGNSPLYQNLAQYNDSSANHPMNSQLAGSWVDTASAYPVSTMFDSDIQNELAHAQSVNGWGVGSPNAIFFVFLAANEGLCIKSSDPNSSQVSCTPDMPSVPDTAGFCAYHSFDSHNSIYAAMPYEASPTFNGGCTPGAPGAAATGSFPSNDDSDITLNVTSHEQMEATTDPLLNAWFFANSQTFFEIGDICAWTFGPTNTRGADVTLNGIPYMLQQEWSNAISSCTLTNNNVTTYYSLNNINSNLVTDVFNGGTNAGAQVIQWANHTGANQQWTLVPDGPFFQIVNRNSGLVLDVSGGGTNDGANVIQWTNHQGLNQQWYLVPDGSNDQIVNANSHSVLDVFGGGTTLGAHVIQWPSHNGTNEEWHLTPIAPYYNIVNRNSGQSIDVFNGGKNTGANAIQFPYHNGLNQQWALIPDLPINGQQVYKIQNLNSGLVMDVFNGGKNAGAQVIQWSDHNGLNQQWLLVPDGSFFQIQNLNSGLVLDVFGGGTTSGVNVIQFTNHDGLNQQWSLIPTSA